MNNIKQSLINFITDNSIDVSDDGEGVMFFNNKSLDELISRIEDLSEEELLYLITQSLEVVFENTF